MGFGDSLNNSKVENFTLSTFFKEATESIDLIDLYNPESVEQRGSVLTGVFTKDCLSEEHQIFFSDFEKLFGVNVSNFGRCYYNELGELTSFYHPKVAKIEKEPYLVIGDDEEELGYTRTLIKIEVQTIVINAGEVDEETEFRYYFVPENAPKVRAQLVTSVVNEKTYYFLGVKSNNNGRMIKFYIPFKLESKKNGVDVYSQVEEYYEKGQLLEILDNYQNITVDLGKCFKSHFMNKAFPERGVLLVLTNPSSWEQEGRNGNYMRTKWELVASSDPGMVVNGYTEGVKHALDDVNFIKTNATFKGAKLLLSRPKMFMGEPKYCAVHITGINAKTKNVEHIPSHTFSLSLDRVSIKAKRDFKDFLAVVNPMVRQLMENDKLSSNVDTQKSLPQSKEELDSLAQDGLEALGFAKEEHVEEPVIEVTAELVEPETKQLVGATNGNGHQPTNLDNNPF